MSDTSQTPERIVILGGGLAAASAAQTLREEGYDGAITLVGAEPELPYERPQLSKEFLKSDADFEVIHDRAWYDDQRVELRSGRRANGLDLAPAGSVRLDDGTVLSFDRLLLATGAEPRALALDGGGSAYTLRTIADARALKERLGEGTRVALIGGGWIGLEVAAAARSHGARPTVLEQAELPLQHVLGTELAGYLRDLHLANGVDLRTGVNVLGLADGVVSTDAGPVEADLVVAAVGAVPAVALAEAAGLRVSDGIEVDRQLRTSDPRVFAAGDVALADHPVLGRLRVEHWDNALRQGSLAARTMLGGAQSYDWAPYFYTDQFTFSMEYVGHSAPDDEVLIRGDLSAGEFIAYWLRDGVLTAGMNVNIWDVNDTLREMLGTSPDPDSLTDLR
ncbi:MAG: FAD-dependent oxidoreductase [Nocardioides sp.]|uniref:NAD(P)/FAD-dependent oxidoreductase n=1 Tax=Nocardioides sp. TaxID=35761 RepID=UPI0039E4066A